MQAAASAQLKDNIIYTPYFKVEVIALLMITAFFTSHTDDKSKAFWV